jgi:hypothetical protein
MPVTAQQRLTGSGQVPKAVPPPPKLPDDVKQRFASLVKWEEDFRKWAVDNLGVVIQLGP